MSRSLRRFRLAGSGLYLPPHVVTADEMDARLGVPAGWVEKKTGVTRRHFAGADDTAASMGAEALARALDAAGWEASTLELVVSASGTMQQPIPCTAVLVSAAMGQALAGVPCFDVNATCASFLVALDLVGTLLEAGRHRRVAIVSTEVASAGLDWSDPASAALFGDGAVAMLLEATDAPTGLEAFRLETYTEGASHCTIKGGGSGLPAMRYDGETDRDYRFRMAGEELHRLAVQYMPAFVERLFGPLQLHPRDLDAIVPHQAGKLPLLLLSKRLGIAHDRLVVTLGEHGNTIAASMPMALHLARASGRIRDGQRIGFIGTGAGISFVGGVWQL